jgi:hypothetical protein
MAVRAFTDEPQELLSAIKKAISDDVINTWKIDTDGDLTHTSKQWGERAWMRPKVLEDRLLFNIIASKNETMSKTLYGVYHGRLIQTLLTHFDKKMKTVSATALATTDDNI